MKSGEETAIPIPRSDDGVAELLARLEADREAVEDMNIDDLEAAARDLEAERRER